MLFHEQTEKQIENLLLDPPHAVMLSGHIGAGKIFAAHYIITNILSIEPDKLSSYPYFRHLQPINSTLTIDQIRGLNTFLSLKTVGTNNIRRVVLIEDAHLMNVEAQNAILKLLEEPPKDTIIILTSLGPRTLKPTIYSRVQQIPVYAVERAQAAEYYSSKGYAEADILRAFHLSNGAIGLMSSLLESDSNNGLVESIEHAKKILKSSVFERLNQADNLAKNPEEIELLLYALKRIGTAALEQAATKQQTTLVPIWSKKLKLILDTQDAIATNANRKLLLTNLFVNL